jgi:hypothetical protein
MASFTEPEKRILKFICTLVLYKRLQIAKEILSKKSNAGGVTMFDFKLYYRTLVTKTTRYWHKFRHADQ